MLSVEEGKRNRKQVSLTSKGESFCKEKIWPLIRAERYAFAKFTLEERQLFLDLYKRKVNYFKEEVKEFYKNGI